MRILVVEDNEDNLALATKVLKFGGHEVTPARNAEEAIRIASESRPDLVLMDLGLPDVDGWEATRQLRQIESMADVPIFALTAHALRPEDRLRATEAGCSEYVTKPFDRRALLDLIQRYANGAVGQSRRPDCAGGH